MWAGIHEMIAPCIFPSIDRITRFNFGPPPVSSWPSCRAEGKFDKCFYRVKEPAFKVEEKTRIISRQCAVDTKSRLPGPSILPSFARDRCEFHIEAANSRGARFAFIETKRETFLP